ncbi:MAG: 5-dehydro-2-deoxygluconokinase [Clostridia bacterium]|nr:5-dehydro-2-deoxygluconokinase [Clostridia bacterium]NCC76644.1 5-dehydro-2-deoxygluconokinase [Clostridia bacterium]
MTPLLDFAANRRFDIILAGRAGIDFNAVELNCRFADVRSYTKSVGGSPANIAQGLQKLGLRTGFIGKVAGDGMGDYVIATLQQSGIDTTGLLRDQTGARNCLAITEVQSPENSGSFLYRERTADLLLEPCDIDAGYVGSARAVLVSGTALSQSPSREAMQHLLDTARKQDVRVLFDLDYRPCGWQSREETAAFYEQAARKSDLIIGNREEFASAGWDQVMDPSQERAMAEHYFQQGARLVVIKDGSRGSSAYTDQGEVVHCGVYPVRIRKSFGSGDSYAAGLLERLARGHTLKEAMIYGTACAAIVLSGAVSCSEAMPTLAQVQDYLATHSLSGS